MRECLQLQALTQFCSMAQRRGAQVVWLGVAVLVGFLSILAQVWTRLQVIEMGYTLSATRQVVRELEEEHQKLEMEWTALTSPARLTEMAYRRLGLERPPPGQVLVLP